MIPVSPVLIGHENNPLEKKIAEEQEQYQTLPALPIESELPGTILTRWEISDEELEKLKETKSVYLYIATFHQPLQPVYLTVETPPVHYVEDDDRFTELRNSVPDISGPSETPLPTIAEIKEKLAA